MKFAMDVNAPIASRAPRALSTPTEGNGSAISHHGEILQGLFLDASGEPVRGLVTLPRHQLSARARLVPEARTELRVYPSWKTKALHAARSTLRAIGGEGWGGQLRVSDTIPAGYGLGSSTSDVVASIRAVADAFGIRLRASAISRLAVLSEQASDSIMFEDRTVLFAQRTGHVLEELGQALPEVEILGLNTEPGGRGIATVDLELPAYTWEEVQLFRPLLGLLRAAVRHGRVEYVGRVATTSARLSQKYLPKRYFAEIERICEQVGAVGIQVSHSGTVAGLMFDPNAPENDERIAEAERRVAELGLNEQWRFRTGGVVE